MMKIAISAKGPGLTADVDPGFGRANHLVVVDADSGTAIDLDNAVNQDAAQAAGVRTAQTVVDAGARTVITGSVGPKAMNALRAAGVEVFLFSGGSVREALEQFKQGKLARMTRPGA